MKKLNPSQNYFRFDPFLSLILIILLIPKNINSNTLLVPQQFSTIQSAIDAATASDTILVSPGTYYENINFLGKSVVVKANGPMESVIINGSQPSDPNKASVIFFPTSGENIVSTLDGFTITGGSGTSANLGKIGGGIYIENSKPIIKNCIIKDNEAVRGGGIACLYDSDHQVLNTGNIVNCVIINNSARNGGGVSTHYWGNIQIDYCTIASNSSSVGSNLTIGSTSTASLSSIKNSILWNGTIRIEYAPVEFNYCDIQGGWSSGIGNIDMDPIFCDVQFSDFRLGLNSPCIGVGENGSTIGALGTCGLEYNVFHYPLELGTTWNYDYYFYYSHFQEYRKIFGNQNWTIMDSVVQVTVTQFRCRVISQVTKLYGYPDTDTTFSTDTSQFYIDRAPSFIVVRPPSSLHVIVDTIKGYFNGSQSIILHGTGPFIPDEGIRYKEGFGLTHLHFENLYTHTKYEEDLRLLEFNGEPVKIDEKKPNLPIGFLIKQNYPNPFNPTTTIEYSIPEQSNIMIIVFDLLGREVATLVDEEKIAGNHRIQFDGSNLPSGIYFYKLQAGDYLSVKKMMLLR